MHKGEILNININKHLYGKSLNRDCIPRAFLPVLHKFFHYIMQLEEMSYPFFFQLLYSSTIFCKPKGGGYFKEGDYSREAIISNNAQWKLCPKYFVSLSR